MHQMGRPLHLLAAGDALLAGLAGGGADIVVEGRDGRRPRRRPHDIGAFRIVGPHHRVMVEEVQVRVGHRSPEQLEPVGGKRRLIPRREPARVQDRHVPLFQIDA